MVELIWDGKYDADGKRVRPVRVALPFQDVETVNETAQTRNLMLDLFARNQPREWRNRLIWGDKKYVLPSLLPEFAGKVDLIYIDPPFATGADFSFTASIPDDPSEEGSQTASFTKQPSIIEQKAYRDTWGSGLDSYLRWLFESVSIMHELLSDSGSLYVHCDWRLSHYLKVIIDEVMPVGFRNEIVWSYGGRGAKANAGQFPRNHDVLLLYHRETKAVFNKVLSEKRVPISRAEESGYRIDSDGRFFKTSPRGDYSDKSIERLRQEGRIYETRSGQIRIKYFLRTDGNYVVEEQLVGDVWNDIPDAMHIPTIEKTGYPTQKPEALLERVISASTNEGDLVLDCFVGSGTTAAVAEKLGRRWIAADLGRFAVHTTRKRLLSIPDVRPFVIQNLGKYERQAWQSAEFAGDDMRAALAQARYRRFILDLYHAEPIDGYGWLHGVHAGHFVHVGSVDAPVLVGDVQAIAREFWQAVGKGNDARTNRVDILGWDFAFELNELGREMAREANIELVYKRIPRDVMDRRAVEQGEIRFFELGALSVDVTHGDKRSVTVALRDFVVPPDDIPEDVQRSITHWSQYIDYWAVDWNYRDDTFHNEWQSYRTKKEPKLALQAAHQYETPGSYTILVKAIDILGNDTTKSLRVEVS